MSDPRRGRDALMGAIVASSDAESSEIIMAEASPESAVCVRVSFEVVVVVAIVVAAALGANAGVFGVGRLPPLPRRGFWRVIIGDPPIARARSVEYVREETAPGEEPPKIALAGVPRTSTCPSTMNDDDHDDDDDGEDDDESLPLAPPPPLLCPFDVDDCD